MKATEGKTPRPTGVTVLGILALLIGVLGFVGGAVLLMSADVFVAALSALAVVIGILYFMAGLGFLREIRWAWTLGLIVSFVSLIRNLAEIADGMIAFGLPGVIIAIIIGAYLTRPHVKAFFGTGPVLAGSSASS